MKAGHMIEAGIALVLSIYVVAALIPNAITTAVNATNSSTPAYTLWGSSVLSLWNLIPLFVVIAIILLLYRYVKA